MAKRLADQTCAPAKQVGRGHVSCGLKSEMQREAKLSAGQAMRDCVSPAADG